MFQAGFSRLDITPPLGSPMAGYGFYRAADGVLDPIQLNTVAVKNGDDMGVLIAADVLYITESAATPIREMISQGTGIPADRIFLHGLHPHTSVRIGERSGANTKNSTTLSDSAYLDVLYRKFVDAAKLAINDLHDAVMEYGEQGTEKQISFVRRYWMKDGSLQSNPGWQNPDIVRPADDADNTVRLIRFKREGAKDIALVNFWTHPDVIGGNQFSADWPGFVRRYTEQDLNDVHCVVFNGPQGDTNHLDFSIPKSVWHDDRYGFSAMMGRTIADTVLKIWDQTEPRKGGLIWGEVRKIHVPTNTSGMDEIEKWKQVKADYASGKNRKLSQNDLGSMSRISSLEGELLFQMVPVSVMGIGDIVFVGFGGEAFTYYGRKVIEMGSDFTVIPITLVNGGEGYLPTAQAFGEGGYEANSSRFTPVLQEKIIGAVQEMLECYQNTKNKM